MDELDLARLRRDYEAAGLEESSAPPDPLVLFNHWLADAAAAALAEVNAMILSTVGPDGSPSSRMVLCKSADERGFAFYTNYESRKGRELAAEHEVSLLFPWHPLGRQVRIEGPASVIDANESDHYFATRPRGAQLSAWASRQSDVVPDRAALQQRYAEMDEQYPATVPRPPHWGGVRVAPRVVEFWQGRRDRLHDRLVYRRDGGGGWSLVRLQP
jgi:pyridoxamine 5'-phosphate oxidase